MVAVAERPVAGMLAATEINRAVFFGGVGLGCEPGSFVRAVAHGLILALAACAPVVGFPGFNGYWIRRFLGNVWFVHNFVLFDNTYPIARMNDIVKGRRHFFRKPDAPV